MRVNARLDDDSSKKLAYLERETGWGVSTIVRKAIESFYREIRRQKTDASTVLEQTGFIACVEGPPDLSESYKGQLSDLQHKHGHR